MFRKPVLMIAVLLFATAVASADAITFDTEADYLLGLAGNSLVRSIEGWDNDPFSDGDRIANGSKINGITYDSRTSIFRREIVRSNIVTDRFGTRSPENALGLSFFGYESPFTRFDAITFRFQHAINSFGISFATGGDPDGATYGIRTNNGYSAASASDPFLFDDDEETSRGQFAGLIGPEAFTEVTVFVDRPFQWENLSFVLDNMIVGREQSGVLSLAVPTVDGPIDGDSLLNFLVLGTSPPGGEPGGTFPAITWVIPDEFDPFSDPLAAGDSAVVLGIIEAQFGSPHIWTGDPGDVDPDVQQALVAAWADIQLGNAGTFPDFLVQRGYFVDPMNVEFGEPGSILEGVAVGDYLDFVEGFNPNVFADGSSMDPSFRMRLDQIYTDLSNQEQFSSSGLEEIIYPHPNGFQLETLVLLPFGPNGQLDASGASAAPVPEPGTLLTLGLAVAAGAVVLRRRRRNAA